MSEIVRYYNEYSDIEISQKTNIHSVYTKNILPLFRKLQDLLDKLFVLNVKIFIVKKHFTCYFNLYVQGVMLYFKTGMHLGCNIHKT